LDARKIKNPRNVSSDIFSFFFKKYRRNILTTYREFVGEKSEPLHPSRGSLMCRLATNCQHMPVKSKSKRPRCQLHRWARGRDGTAVMNQIIACSVCCVDLCVECFNIFHKEANLGDWKESIGAISDREKNVGR